MAKRPRKKSRERSLDRRYAKRAPRERILIVCEDEKSAPRYFKELAKKLGLSTYVEVRVFGAGATPSKVVEKALELEGKRKIEAARTLKTAEFDQVWCVFDVEFPTPHADLNTAMNMIKDEQKKRNSLEDEADFNSALSNPCIEYWFLLHFIDTSAPLTNDEAVTRLKSEYPQYSKGGGENKFRKFVETIYPKTESAIKRSKQVIANREWEKDLRKYNPSTDVHILVEYLLKISKSQPVLKTR